MFLLDCKAIAALDGRPQTMGLVQTRKTLLRGMPQAVLSQGKYLFEIPKTIRIFFSFLIHEKFFKPGFCSKERQRIGSVGHAIESSPR